MPNIAVVTDSTSYLNREELKQWNIHEIPLNVVVNEETMPETDWDAATYYQTMRNSETLPTTSQPSPGKMEDLYRELAREADEIISIHLSSGISGTHQTAVAVADDIKDTVHVHCYDSEISARAQGYFVLTAARMASEGYDMAAIFAELDKIKETMRAYFIVEDLRHLQRGGRLSGAQAMVGSMLRIKPVLKFTDKKIVPYEKVRTSKKALARIQSLFLEEAAKGPLEASVLHANAEEAGEAFRRQLQEASPESRIILEHLGPVIGTHLGENAIGLAWYRPEALSR